MKRSINERIEDGILLLAITSNHIRANKPEKIELTEEEVHDLSVYFPKVKLYKFKYTEDQFKELEKLILDWKYKDKFYKSYFSDNTSGYSDLLIKDDKKPSQHQRIAVNYCNGILSLSYSTGRDFGNSKKYKNQIADIVKFL